MDQIEFEKEVRECNDPKSLYKKSEHVCFLYDQKQIPKLQWEESMDLVKERMRVLTDLKNQIPTSCIILELVVHLIKQAHELYTHVRKS